MGAGGASADSVKVAKTAAATTYEDAGVKNAGDNARRRIAAANSRDKSNTFWSSLMTASSGGSGGKTTLG